MRCSMDLMTTAMVVQEEQRVAKQIAEEKHQIEVMEKTVKWCEEVGKILEEKAEKGFSPRHTFVMWGADEMIATYDDYADRRKSYKYSGNELNLGVIKEWFKQYCFTLDIQEIEFWKYFYGKVRGLSITIEPDPICL